MTLDADTLAAIDDALKPVAVTDVEQTYSTSPPARLT